MKNANPIPTRSSFGTLAKRTAQLTLLAQLVAFSGACVTVNVNFPESAVQKATDDYVRDLYRTKSEDSDEKAKPAPTSSSFEFHWIPSAFAEEAFKVASPKSLEIRERMRGRVAEILAQKRSGTLGETQDGLIVVRENAQVKSLMRAKLDQLVAAENRDRKALYEEVLSSNALPPARLINVQKSFARSFQAESPSKTWVEDAAGNWTQKP
jgi:uncharacterized protein YdbL (DUF1318 family)